MSKLSDAERRAGLLEPGSIRVMRYCLGFVPSEKPHTEVTWIASPMLPFRIHGIQFFGVNEESQIVRCQIGNVIHMMASTAPLPAKFFESGIDFGLFKDLFSKDPHEADWSAFGPEGYMFARMLTDFPEMLNRQLLDFDTLSLGGQLSLTVRGECKAIVAWGWAAVG